MNNLIELRSGKLSLNGQTLSESDMDFQGPYKSIDKLELRWVKCYAHALLPYGREELTTLSTCRNQEWLLECASIARNNFLRNIQILAKECRLLHSSINSTTYKHQYSKLEFSIIKAAKEVNDSKIQYEGKFARFSRTGTRYDGEKPVPTIYDIKELVKLRSEELAEEQSEKDQLASEYLKLIFDKLENEPSIINESLRSSSYKKAEELRYIVIDFGDLVLSLLSRIEYNNTRILKDGYKSIDISQVIIRLNGNLQNILAPRYYG